eukprot:CAMPEP_0197936396 /NCGR_PEP_ID=MMETSP1439-20131203/114853_1 /TAXON_ID=66791 /ORGANISM="Gonyaulax spinifera, Strain CCMP409" /LENGTH=120 /DNA_ID=CAMNT_0043559365 /DNA_START=98 /DNA_END=461 /DNA_ORIENTATION=-
MHLGLAFPPPPHPSRRPCAPRPQQPHQASSPLAAAAFRKVRLHGVPHASCDAKDQPERGKRRRERGLAKERHAQAGSHAVADVLEDDERRGRSRLEDDERGDVLDREHEEREGQQEGYGA